MRIAILYERNTQPDEHVARVLETELRARQYEVFVDRNPAESAQWAREMKNQVRSSDVVIPLFSSQGVTSETLAHEVRLAYEAAQQQEGKPRLLPVRVNYLDPLPRYLSNLIDTAPLVWMSPQDDSKLTETILQALMPDNQPSLAATPSLEPVGGAVPLASGFYIVRPVDQEFQNAIARHDSIVLVKGARQMGKTSVLARGLQLARNSGSKVIHTDFQKLNEAHFATIETFFQMLADLIVDQLDLDVDLDKVWNPRRGPNMNFERFLRREVLEKLEVPLVWGLDEVDRLFTCHYGSEVFGLFRSWHNERSLDPTGPWQRLTLAIAYATEAHLFITDMNQSPFNVGTRLTVEDFTFEQVAELNRRYGSPLKEETDLARFFQLVGGHPFLVRRGLHEIASRNLEVATFEAQCDRDEGLFSDHLNRMRMSLQQDQFLCFALRQVLVQGTCPNSESFYRLRSAGVILGDSAADAMLRCQVYGNYLKRHL
ncbi:MAG: AAA-like domain-containing protein [Blastocatellia bacterium]|nr:AAA-like domain-containing protein [Blastocatellia bacterium]